MAITLDPVRRLIQDRTAELGVSHADLSRQLGRSASYINQYLRRGSPVALDDRERVIVAKALQIDETLLIPDEDAKPAEVESVVAVRQQMFARNPRYMPVFNEDRELDHERAGEWTERPAWVAISEQSFALWIHNDYARLRAGDLAYVSGGMLPRPRDMAVVLGMDQRSIIAIGEMDSVQPMRVVLILADGKRRSFTRSSHMILKVAAIRCA